MLRVAVDCGRGMRMASCGAPIELLAVRGERAQGPTGPVRVVLEVKHVREASAGNFVLAPGAVVILRAEQVVDAALEALVVRIIESAETHDGPGGLAGGAWAFAFENGIVVSVAAFAPAAIFVLHAFQP